VYEYREPAMGEVLISKSLSNKKPGNLYLCFALSLSLSSSSCIKKEADVAAAAANAF
jgi:hypothetical protein